MSAAASTTYRLVSPGATTVPAVTLDASQRAVTEHSSGPLLVVGGPGTGKSRVLVESVAARVDAGEPPERIVVLTGSRAAAVAMRARIARRVGSAGPSVLTFHALCRQLLLRYGAAAEPGAPEPRLLIAAEQDAMLRDALDGWGRERWPEELRQAVGSRAFVEQLRTIFARARALGMDPEDLAAVGRRAERPEWDVAGEFFEEYLELLDFRAALDYAELVHRARLLLADPATLDRVRRDVARVFVDEYQDVDETQAALLRQLVGAGGDIVALGDPDQSIFSFRQTASRALLDFPAQFGGRAPAAVVALAVDHRHGSGLAAALEQLGSRLPAAAGLPEHVRGDWRRPRPAGTGGKTVVALCESPSAQGEHVADLLRRAHLDDGIPWSRMAVIVRSARRGIPALARALASHGVPAEVAGDEVALAEEPAVKPLLLALGVACGVRDLDADAVAALLASPLGSLDGLERRRLVRALRRHAVPNTPADELLRQAVVAPELLDAVEAQAATAAERVRGVAESLNAAREVARHGTAHEVLWELWSHTSWPERLRDEAIGGGDGAPAANHDLDAVSALFELAHQQAGEHNASPAGFLVAVAAQRLPATLGSERGGRGEAVRVLTAHRAKDQEWELVVVAGVQEGLWPRLRAETELLDAERLLPDGLAAPRDVTTQLAEERRLFYVACSRATRLLYVTAVDSEDERPSRFLRELGVGLELWPGRPRHPRTLAGIVAELRCTAADPAQSPELRAAAASRLARLADALDAEGRPVAPWADPERWWGVLEPSAKAAAVAGANAPVDLTPSALEDLLQCPRRWFLGRHAGVQESRAGASSLGSVVHAIVENAAAHGWDRAECLRRLDEIWPELTFAAPWQEKGEREAAEAMLDRYLHWQSGRDAALIGVEVPFDVTLEVGEDRVRLHGAVDRLERAGDGLRVVDFKTTKHPPSKTEVATLPQFGVYQVAVEEGAFAGVSESTRAAGAVGVYLRKGTDGPTELVQPALGDHPWPAEEATAGESSWAREQLRVAAATVRAGEFPATPCADCQFCAFRAACPAQTEGRQVQA